MGDEESTSDDDKDSDMDSNGSKSAWPVYAIKIAHERKSDGDKPLMARVKINDKNVNMEIDTGSGKSIISYKEYRQRFSRARLRPVSVLLKTVTGQKIDLCGTISVKVEYNKQKCVLPLLVIKGDNPSLMGRDWLSVLRVDWKKVFQVNQVTKLTDSISNYDVFKDDLGCVKPGYSTWGPRTPRGSMKFIWGSVRAKGSAGGP
ncbi:hypothetical protein BSL78_27588 [Apostichopus japonicus]|uniref:Peptidase A2 domain-containing protein n=1 Tax=Stichopus japonicus TaxID=307972 RepID=A0A2G8JIM6_STIJA|nr:hypothetical protein BSL78_27588 [Apostichopus japonicus]